MDKKDRIYRLARLIQQTSKTIKSKNKRISKYTWSYKQVPYILYSRKTRIEDLRSRLITELMKEILKEKYIPGNKINLWTVL